MVSNGTMNWDEKGELTKHDPNEKFTVDYTLANEDRLKSTTDSCRTERKKIG